jgi:hypothetical protein
VNHKNGEANGDDKKSQGVERGGTVSIKLQPNSGRAAPL